MRALRALLELGADPNAGGRRSTPLGAVMLHHPRQARDRIAQLLLACIKFGGHQQLFSHSLHSLEAHLRVWAGGPQPAAAVEVLREILQAAIGDADDCSSCPPANLQALLSSGLPFDLNNIASPIDGAIFWSPLRSAALTAGNDAAAKVRLLHQAGASLAAADLLHLIDGRFAAGLAALLSAGSPAVDTSRPSLRLDKVTSYSCPIHRALHSLVRCPAVKPCDALSSNGFGGVL